MKSEEQQLFLRRERKRGAQELLRLHSRTVGTLQGSLNADKSVFCLQTGEGDAVPGRKSGTDHLTRLHQLRDGCGCVAGQKERAAAADSSL